MPARRLFGEYQEFPKDVPVIRRGPAWVDPDHKVVIPSKAAPVQPENLAQQPLVPVSCHGLTGLPGYIQAKPRPPKGVCLIYYRYADPGITFSARKNRQKIRTLKQPVFLGETGRDPGYTVSRFLPLARRLFNTSRPPRVLIRAMNPWVRLRLILWG